MNLSLILTMPGSTAGTTPGAATPSQAPIPPEMASFQDFLAVMGLSPMAVEPALEEGVEVVPKDATLLAANDTGNVLPPALPVLPELAVSMFQPQPTLALPVTEMPAAAPQSPTGHSAPVAITLQPMSAQPATEQATISPANLAQGLAPIANPIPAAPGQVQASGVTPAIAPAIAGQPPAQTSAPAALQVELVLPPASPPSPVQAAQQAQVVPQPVLAQLLGTAPRPAIRKTADDAIAPTAPAATTAEPVEKTRVTTTAPVLPVIAPAAVIPAAPDLPSAQVTTSAPNIAAADTPARHDFAAVIDKLAQARDLARPGRADMHLLHREFGQVSVQFELAGQALKVAMASPDAAFAPAVQAALAERPITAGADAVRADPTAPRGENATAASASWQAGPQADGQRGDGQRQFRTGNARVQQQHEGEPASRQQAADRDGSRFA